MEGKSSLLREASLPLRFLLGEAWGSLLTSTSSSSVDNPASRTGSIGISGSAAIKSPVKMKKGEKMSRSIP